MATICVNCKHSIEIELYNLGKTYHVCRAFPLPARFDYVTGVEVEPLCYDACWKKNQEGKCPLFEEEKEMMEDLIEALQIFLKYCKLNYPIGCEHDVLYVFVDPALVSSADKARLDELGFAGDNKEPGSFIYYC